MHMLNHQVHIPRMAPLEGDLAQINSIRHMGGIECWDPLASVAGVGALVVVGNVVVLCTGDALGVCNAVTTPFSGTILKGIVGIMIGFSGVAMHGAACTAAG